MQFAIRTGLELKYRSKRKYFKLRHSYQTKKKKSSQKNEKLNNKKRAVEKLKLAFLSKRQKKQNFYVV